MADKESTAVTYLDICPCCRKSARVVTAAGKKTGGFKSKEGGEFLIGVLVKRGHILPEEAQSLHEALAGSELREEMDIFPWRYNEGAEADSEPQNPQKTHIH